VDLQAPDAAAVDAALQQAGFLLVTGHGVAASLRAEVRAAARRFFALPTEVKQRYAARIGGRGWLAPGVESNGNADVFGDAEDAASADNPPDLKESFAIRRVTPPSTRSGSRRTCGRRRCRNCMRPPRATWRR
jgi:isopenicillin N synthase-like dioxygenase